MSYNGSGTFNINSTGQPVVAGTVITASAFNALTTDLATGLTTAITKDGQTTTTARITFAQGITSSLVTDSSSVSTGSIITAGGAGIAKALYVGTTANVAGAVTLGGVATFSAQPIFSSLTASSAVATDASKGLVSVTNTGTGNNVLATSPTITTPTISSLSSAAATALTLQSAGTTAITVDTSQNVGIGTSSPTGKLHVSAPASTQYGTFDAVTASYAFTNYKVGGTAYGYIGDASGLVTSGTAGDLAVRFSGAMVFSGGANERMRIDSSGNVGIGTTTPGYPLQVYTSSSSNAATISMVNNATSNTSSLAFVQNGSTTASYSYIVGDGRSSGYMSFATNNAERMRIISDGKVLVGCTSAFSSIVQGIQAQASGSASLALSRTTDTGAVARFFSTSTEVGNISVTGSTTTFNSTSDYRLKENVQPMTGALAKVAQLKPVTYKWKVDGSNGQGFIAHELAEVVPDCVTGEKDALDKDGNPSYQGIDTSFLVATLTAAIQEAKALIDTQAETINALTARIVALENA